MTVHTAVQVQLAFDGSGIDGSLFGAITAFARETKWLNALMEWWTNAGLGVFGVLMLAGWWQARRRDAHAMALALVAPVCVLLAYGVAEVAKQLVGEVRPCYSLPHDYFVDSCPVRSDYAFPSGHEAVAAASVAALFLLDRRLSVIAAAFTLLEGFTRVYVGAHYPHDVLGAVIVALPVAFAASLFLGRVAAPGVARLRTGVLRPVLASAATASSPH
jgi:membrane-associated phospholipid phosphatase